MDFVHRSEFQITGKQNVSETWSSDWVQLFLTGPTEQVFPSFYLKKKEIQFPKRRVF
jgi:hypothetical protein